jgi:hypothetical protein
VPTGALAFDVAGIESNDHEQRHRVRMAVVDGPDAFRRSAAFVSKILQGAKPADLPVEQPTKFELVVNLKTAKALGLKIAESFLLRADTVIDYDLL